MGRGTVAKLGLAATVIAATACGGASDASIDTATSVADSSAAEVSTASTEAPVDDTEPADTEPADTAPATDATPPATEPDSTEPLTTEPVDPAAEYSTVAALLDAGRPVNLAHAGGDQSHPHSTMFAFREAVADGADALEMDVQLTGDGVLVVQHDDTVDRTTETTGRVDALTLDELQVLDNAYWFSPACWGCQDLAVEDYIYRGVRTGDVAPPDGYTADDFRVETFQSIAEAFPNMVLDVEIKGTFPDGVPAAEELASLIDQLGLTDRVVVVSFDDQLLDAFHAAAPEVALSPGLTRLTEWFLNGTEIEEHFTIFQVPPFQGDVEVVNTDTVQRVHDEGRAVWVWPNDASSQENSEFYRAMIDLGVDGIIAGRPEEMTAALS